MIEKLTQIGVVLPDLEGALAFFTEGLGVGPFLNIHFGSVPGDPAFSEGALEIADCIKDGKYLGSYGICMGAYTFPCGIQLEMIQPATPDSLFDDYLQAHGAGIQHIAIASSLPFAETVGRMALAGNPIATITTVDHQERCAFVHHEERLGLCIETFYRPDDYGVPDGEPPMVFPNREKCPEPLVTDIVGAVMTVPEPDRTRALLEEYGAEIKTQNGNALSVEVGGLSAAIEAGQGPACMHTLLLQAGKDALPAIRAAVEAFGGKVLQGSDRQLTADLTELLGMKILFQA